MHELTDSYMQGQSGSCLPFARRWQVSSLVRAIADNLEARFNPVTVEGEVSGFSRAASGHCYFSLKDNNGQVRCAMFRRAASLLDFSPKDGQRVELRGRVGVYEPRGELQLVVESMRQSGIGNLFEQFQQIKNRLGAEGLFDLGRKRTLPLMPKAIGVVTSLGAAALHDVMTTLRRRVPHIPVIVYPSSVQGDAAAAELCLALSDAYLRHKMDQVDVLLLVRGGGAAEDLWAFNDERLARTIVASPIPVVCGIGHETDFTISDFCADVRAPTPTAAAEMCARPRSEWFDALASIHSNLRERLERQLQIGNQRLDLVVSRFSRPSYFLMRQRTRLTAHGQGLQFARRASFERFHLSLSVVTADFPGAISHSVQEKRMRHETAGLKLELLNPRQVLKRGYAWLSDARGLAVTHASQTRTGQSLRAILADGEVDLTVSETRLI